MLKVLGEERARTATHEEYNSIVGARLGPTMADGGDHVEEHEVSMKKEEQDRFDDN